MSLKTFHLLFVTASSALAFAFAAWGIDAYTSRGDVSALTMAVLAFIFGAGLVVYGIRVRIKLKGLGVYE